MEKLRKTALISVLGALVAVSLMVLPGRSGAATFENTLAQGALTSPFLRTIGDGFFGVPGNTFLDHYTFSLTPASSFDAVGVQIDLGSTFGLNNLGINLYTSGGSLIQSGATTGGLAILPATIIGSGAYDLRVSGTLTGSIGGGYGGTMSAAPIPEPETYAMMLAGLGLMGFVARRRKQKEIV